MALDAAEESADNAAVVLRLSAVLENPAMADVVTIVSLLSERDGAKMPAPAILLASCSPVFLKMLTGSFAEGAASRRSSRRKSLDTASADACSSAPTVSCAFGREALAAVVAFAKTNDADALWNGEVMLLVEILRAAEYYDIEGLRCKAKRQLVALVRERPEEACGLLEAVWDSQRWAADEAGAGAAGELAETALAVIDGSAGVALKSCECLCEEAMEKVLGRRCIGAGEEDLFKALRRWVEVGDLVVGGQTSSRTNAGERLASCVSLELMSPKFFAEVVVKSGLVSKEVLLDVFQKLAVKAEESHGLNSGTPTREERVRHEERERSAAARTEVPLSDYESHRQARESVRRRRLGIYD